MADDNYTRPADHDKRIVAARARMAWELGSPSWADRVLHAYENPDADAQALQRDKED